MRGSWLTLGWWKDNVDTVALIIVVVVMSVLATANVVSAEVITQTLPAILGVFAIAMLRDRAKVHAADQHLEKLSEIASRIDLKVDGIPALRVLTGTDIGDALAETRRGTSLWIFRGGTGTYTRTVTLPDCVAEARKTRRVLQIRVEIIDPTNPLLCEEYAGLYRRLAVNKDDDASSWTGEATRRESYATVLASCWYKQRFAPLTIDVGLSSGISTFRYDMSSRHLVITQRGPRFPAILVDFSRPQYDHWRFELDMSFYRSHQLAVNTVAPRFPLDNWPTHDQVRALFEALKIGLPAEYDDAAIDDIVTKAIATDQQPLVRGAGDLQSRR